MMNDVEAQVPIVVQPIPHKKIGFLKRAKADRAKLRHARQALNFSQELRLASVSAKAKTKSIEEQYGLTTREARLCAKLVKPKKHRQRSKATGSQSV